MSPEFEALRQDKSAFASAIAAAIGFSLFCLVGAAVLMGWIGPGVRPANVLPPPPSAAARAQANEMGLSPGETVVSAAEAPVPPAKAEASPAPTPATPAAPAPSSSPKPPAAKAAEPRRPYRRHHAAARAAPADSAGKESTRARTQSPAVAQASPHPTDADDKWPQPACGNCGVVQSIRVFPDLWEIRVRFDDGGHRTLRYSRPQHWHAGDRIRYEGGRLVPE